MTIEEAKAVADELAAQHASQTAPPAPPAAPGVVQVTTGAGAPAAIDWGKLILIVKFLIDNWPAHRVPEAVHAVKAAPVSEEPHKGGHGKSKV